MSTMNTGLRDIVDVLTVYIADEIIGDGMAVEPDENLLMDGRVDSLGMLRVVSHIEARFDVKVAPDQFTIENFRTINAIARYVDSLLNGAGGP